LIISADCPNQFFFERQIKKLRSSRTIFSLGYVALWSHTHSNFSLNSWSNSLGQWNSTLYGLELITEGTSQKVSLVKQNQWNSTLLRLTLIPEGATQKVTLWSQTHIKLAHFSLNHWSNESAHF
jgi:hypothetical protein